MKKLIAFIFSALVIAESWAAFAVTSIIAQQRDSSDGKVDIEVRLSGTAEELAGYDCKFAATNVATKAQLVMSHIEKVGEDIFSGEDWKRHYVWDAKADVGAVQIDEVALTVDVVKKLGGVQLWENGPCFAECNIGATKPEEYGCYFWWGDTVGYYYMIYGDDWKLNKWISALDGSSFSFTPGCCPTSGKSNSQLQSEGYIDSIGNLTVAYDAATVHLGAPWRMPTVAEFESLRVNCDEEWTTQNGVGGYLVTGRGSYSSKSIFLPAAGVGGTLVYSAGIFGYYWSSTPISDDYNQAWHLYFYKGNIDWGYGDRSDGRPVRPVREYVAGASEEVVGSATTQISIDMITDAYELTTNQDGTTLLVINDFDWAKRGSFDPKEETQWLPDGEYEGKTVYTNNNINDSESTSIEFTIPDGLGSISFAWKVDSEQGYDCLHWYLDEEERGCISGEQDWTIITEELSEGEHTLKFGYSKDESVANGSDAGWVAILTEVVPKIFADCQIKELTLNESAGKVPYSFFATVPSVEKINVPSKEWWFENAPTHNNPVAEGTASLYVGGEKVEWGLADGGPYTEIVDGVEYTFYVENGEAMIRSRYSFLSPAIPTSTSGTLIVPGILGNCPVTRIGDGAFFRCDSLEDVQLPDGLITIGGSAFSGCFSLQSVTIPDSVTTIGEDAFGVCGSLHTIVLSESLKEIGDFAFDRCGLLSVSIPKGVTKIGTSTFYGCESLQSVTFTDGLTEIGEYAFERCMSLETVSIPGSVKKIGRCAFCGCTALCTAMLHEGLEMIEDHAFEDCASLQFVEIPSSVTTIGECTFCRCETLESLTLHEGLKEIGELSFQGCNSLQTVILPNGLTTIGEGAFSYCESLQSVTIPESVTADIWGLFYWSESIKEIVGLVWNSEAGGMFPNGMFPNLERVVVSRHMTEIVPYQFSGCSSLTSVVIPDSVTKIGESAFMGCDSLETLPIPKSVTEIGDYAFSYCTLLQSITIPENVTEIGEHAFWMCESLRSAILPATLISIGDDAFGGCKSLQSITIPDGVTTIGNCAFWGCESFQTITIPESVTDLGEGAFDGCSSLKEIVGWRPSIGLLYDVERIVVSSRITEIDRGAFWGCESLQTVILPDGLTTIRESAFEGCSSLALVTIPSSVAMLGEHAFERCCSLTSVEIPTSVMVIPDCAFSGCSALERVSIPAGVSVIGDGAFIGCGFTLITIPESVAVIGDLAFADCDSLQSITIPGGVTTIGAGAFIECTSLTAVNLRKGLTTIGDDAFLGCGSLQSITIPMSVMEIGRNPFYECSSLNTIYVDEGDTDRVKELMRDAGVEVDSLEFVELTNKVPVIDGDSAAEVTGDAETGFVVKPSEGTTDVVITIPEGVAAEKVTIEVSPSVQSIKANGATIKVVKGAADITEYLDIPAAVDGVVNLGAAEVKEAIVKETLDPEQGAEIELSSEEPTLTTAETKPGLTYTLVEGTTLESMTDGDSKLGDGNKWTPNISVKGGKSGFYSIKITK